MCDFSLEAVRSRPAQVGDKLVTHYFSSGTRGFCAAEDPGMAVCLLPGTELSFSEELMEWPMAPWASNVISRFRAAIFRKVNEDRPYTHHDALEFPDGKIVLLTNLRPGQQATVLQLPAEPQQARPEKVAHDRRAGMTAELAS